MINEIAEFLRWEASQDIRDESLYHPSDGGACTLSVWFTKKAARGISRLKPAPEIANTLLTFRVGHLMHQWVQDHYVRSGICSKDNIELRINDPSRQITGSIDIYLPDKKQVLDIKTCSWLTFTGRLPDFKHIIQTSIYSYYVGADSIAILYIAKEGGRLDRWIAETGRAADDLCLPTTNLVEPDRIAVRKIEISPRHDLVQYAFKKFSDIEEAIHKDEAPNPDYSPTEPCSPCTTCRWRHHCRDLTGRRHPGLEPTPPELL